MAKLRHLCGRVFNRCAIVFSSRIGVARQVGALGQVLAQQPISVLMSPTLPGAVHIGKEDLDRESLGQACVFGHLVTPIVGQRFPQRGRHRPELSGEPLSGTPRIGPVEPGQMTRCVVRSARLPTAEPFRAPLIKSPSQWPGAVRLATSARRSAICSGEQPRTRCVRTFRHSQESTNLRGRRG